MYICNIFLYILLWFIAPKGWFIGESQAAVARTHGYGHGHGTDDHGIKTLTIDVNNKTSTNNLTYSYNRANNSCTFTPKYPYRIERVTNGKRVVWDAANFNYEYGSQLVGTLKDNGTYSYRVYFDKDMKPETGAKDDAYYGASRHGTYYYYNDPHYKSEYRRSYRDYEDPYYHSSLHTYQDYDDPYQRQYYRGRRGYGRRYGYDSGSDYEYGGRGRYGRYGRRYGYGDDYRYGGRYPYRYDQSYYGLGRSARALGYDYGSVADYQYRRGRMAGYRGARDYGYGTGYRDYGYGSRYRDYGYGTGTRYRDYGYGRSGYGRQYGYDYDDYRGRGKHYAYDSASGSASGSEYEYGGRRTNRYDDYQTGRRAGRSRTFAYDSGDDYRYRDSRSRGRNIAYDSGDERAGRNIAYESSDDRRGGRRYSLDSDVERRGRSGRRDFDYHSGDEYRSVSEGEEQQIVLDVNNTRSTREIDYYFDKSRGSHNFVPKAGYAVYRAMDHKDVIWNAKGGKYPSHLVVTRDRSGRPKLEVFYDRQGRSSGRYVADKYGVNSSVGGITLDVTAYWTQHFKDCYYTATEDSGYIKYAFKSNVKCVNVKCDDRPVWRSGDHGMYYPKTVKYSKPSSEILISDGSTVLVYRLNNRDWQFETTKGEDSFFKKIFGLWGSKTNYDHSYAGPRTMPYRDDDDLHVSRARKREGVSYFATSMSAAGRPSQYLTGTSRIHELRNEERAARAKVMAYPDDDNDYQVGVSHQTRLRNVYQRANAGAFRGGRAGVYRAGASGRLTQDIPLPDD